jgi:hypothetical protein
VTPEHVAGLLSGAALAAIGAMLARAGLKGGGLRRSQHCALVCPRLERPVECRVVQDLRTGQWKGVSSCSAFEDPRRVLCELDCVKQMNLGLLVPRTLPF